MPLRVHVDVVSAEELIFSGETDFAVFPGESGDLGVFPRHTPLLTRVRPGIVRLKIPNREEYELIYVSGGLLEVQPTLITLLVDTAVRTHDRDEARAIEAKQHAEEVKKNQAVDVGYALAEAELVQSIAHLQTLKKRRKPH